MQVVTREGAGEAAHLAARLVIDAVRVRPNAVLGLATGRTMEPLYAELARLHRDEALDFSSADPSISTSMSGWQRMIHDRSGVSCSTMLRVS